MVGGGGFGGGWGGGKGAHPSGRDGRQSHKAKSEYEQKKRICQCG